MASPASPLAVAGTTLGSTAAATAVAAAAGAAAGNAVAERPAMIAKRFVFGVRNEVKDGIQYIDEFTCCWIAGKSLVVYNAQYATQKYIPCSDTCEAVTAMAVSTNRRTLAIAESSDTPCIVIYTQDAQTAARFKRKRVLSVPDVGSKEYVCLAFSLDGRYLASQGGFPDWNLVLWNVDKAKALAMYAVMDKASPSQDRRLITQCSICPKDAQLLCVSGNGVFRFVRYAEGQLRQAPGGIKGDPLNYVAHVWLPPEDRMIVSTDNGDLLLIEDCEYKYPLPLSPSDGLSIDSLIAHSKGFICGGDMGLVTIFERSEDKELYRKMRTLKVESDHKSDEGTSTGEDAVKVLAFSLTPPPSEEYLSIMTSNKQLYFLNLSNADFSKADDHVFDPIAQPFHAGAITGLDVCVRKPLIVTCGKDRNLFLWNYVTNTVEIAKRFSSEILSVAIHPSGLHLLVGFPDKLRFMNIYGDDIREFKSFGIRACSECRFSNGGQFFAAMHSTIIHVYFTYTCELLGHLRGHNGKIKSIFFCPPDDTRVISVGVDGAIFEFNLGEFHKVNDHVIKAISYNGVTATATTVWAAGNDRKLRQIEREHLAPQAEFDLRNTAAQCLAQASGLWLLFAGCEDGSLRVFNTNVAEKAILERAEREKFADKDPKGDQSQQRLDITIESHAAHSSAITRVAVSFDENIVVSTGEDGLLTIWEIVAPHKGAKKEVQFAEEILIDKKDLEDKTRGIMDLQNKVSELKQRMEQQQYKRELHQEEKIQSLKDKWQEEAQKQAEQLQRLHNDKNEQEIKFRDYLLEMDGKHSQDIQKIESDYTAKIQALEEQSAKLKAAIDEQRAEFEQQKAQREGGARVQTEEQGHQHDKQLDEERRSIRTVRDDIEHCDGEAKDVCTEIEVDTDMEIMTLKEGYEKRMKDEQENCARLKGENSMMQMKEAMIKGDLDAKKSDIAEKQKHQANLHTQIKGYEKDIEALRHELNERSETIGDKDKRIYDLKKKNQELEKFKFVLEYKIKELKSQIDPREEEIRQAHAKYAEMEAEAERYVTNNESLVLSIRGHRLKLDGQQREIESLQTKIAESEEFQTQLYTELSDLYEEKNPKKLKERTKALYYKHTSNSQQSTLLAAKATEDPQRDYNRNRDYLERTVAGLKKKMVKDAEANRTDRSRIINENVTLIKEINELRREVRTLQHSRRMLDIMPSGSGGEDSQRELEIQRAELQRLRKEVEELERKLHAAGKPVSVAPAPLMK